MDKLKKRTNLLDKEAVSSSNQNEECLWVDGYKCLLCGVELPPSFVEERQEHADFHLAERLQKGESDSNLRSLTPKQRYHSVLVMSLNSIWRACLHWVLRMAKYATYTSPNILYMVPGSMWKPILTLPRYNLSLDQLVNHFLLKKIVYRPIVGLTWGPT